MGAAAGEGVPHYSCDFYGDAFIQDPWPHYAAMRALGPVVFIPDLGNYALTQYAAVRAALSVFAQFESKHGVAGDAFGCEMLQGNTVASEPPRHTDLRRAMEPPLQRRALQNIQSRIQSAADALVNSVANGQEFDAISGFAQSLPLTVVRDLVGLPIGEQNKMLEWAGAAFDVLGVQNARGQAALEPIKQMRGFISARATPESLKPGSWTHRIACAAAAGEIDPELAPFVIRDYINPSLDTTISAIGQMIWLLGRYPDQWATLKQEPKLVPNAVHEAVRLSTPIRSFSRRAAADMAIGGVVIPEDARVMMLYASANRDALEFENPDMFNVRRNARRPIGFGAGPHMCVGMHLALAEMEAILRALLEKVERIEVSSPEIAMNNTVCAFSSLQARFIAR